MTPPLPVSGSSSSTPTSDAATAVDFYETLIGKLSEVLGWMNEQLEDDPQGIFRSLATKYAVHRGLEGWADPEPDPQIDPAREAAIILLALGRPRPR